VDNRGKRGLTTKISDMD